MALAKHWYKRLKGGEVVYNNEIKKTKGFLDDYPLNILEGKLIVCATPGPDQHLFNAYESYHHFIMATCNIDPMDKHFYEIIPGDWLQKPHFDLDFKISDGIFTTTKPDGSSIVYTPQQILEFLIQAIVKVLEEVHITINLETDILIYSSSLGEKQSYHLIVNNWFHKRNEEAQGFYHAVVSKIPTELNTGKLIDASVYSKTQQFRILESTKISVFRPKTLLDSFMYEGKLITHQYPILKDVPEDQKQKQLYIQKFEESLITQVSNCNALPDFVKPDATIKTGLAQHLEFQITPNIATYALSQLPSRASYKISKIKEGLIILQRTRPSLCEMCKRIHESENPYLKISNSGGIWYYCRRTSGSIPIGGLPIDFLNQLKETNLQAQLKVDVETKLNEGLTVYHNDPNLAQYGIPKLEIPILEEKKVTWDPISVSDLTNLNIDVYQEPSIKNINKVAEEGKLDLLKTLCKKIKPTSNTLDKAGKKGHLNIVEYLWNFDLKPSEEGIEEVCINGKLEILKFYVEKDIKIPETHINIASTNGYLEMVQYLISIGFKATTATLNRAVENEHLEVVKFLISLRVKATTNTLNLGIRKGNLEIVQRLLNLGLKLDPQSFEYAKKWPKILELIK